MAQTLTTTQNQNVQLTKTFIVAFAGMLFALPIVAVLTAAIVKAQFGSIAYAQAANQSNSVAAAPSCAVPADEVAKNAADEAERKNGGVISAFKWLPVNQSNYNSTSTTTNTTTNTDNTRVITKNNGNTSVDNRWSGNTLGLTLTDNRVDNRNSGNTYNTDNSNVSNNGNTAVINSGNTTSSSSTTNTTNNNVNTNVNSNNTVVNDNDGIDVL